jgi:DNA-binding CsgD family transcriptional regulator/PHD/YefM family antitoxin component YafN of YafNO toxin-antitoxin module
MEDVGTISYLNFDQRMSMLKLFAEELPATILIHRTLDLNLIYMNKSGYECLGVTDEDLPLLNNLVCTANYFHAEESKDYLPKIIYLIKSNSNDPVCYFQQIHNQKHNEWFLYVSNTKVFCRNEEGQPTHIITISSKIDPYHHITTKVNRLMEELKFFRAKSTLFLKLTKREKEVLKCIALGMNSGEISNFLFISPATVDTHRRNLRNKLCLRNNYDTVKFAQAYNLV